MVDKRIKGYELDLLYGRDIYIKGVKIINYKLGDIDNLLFSETFYELKKYLTEFKSIGSPAKNTHMNVDVLANFLMCENVSYNEDISSYCVQYLVDDETLIMKLNDNEVEMVFLILKEMYWCNKSDKNNSELIDESNAADEEVLNKIRKINENRIKYSDNKKDSGITFFSAIERCSSLGIGGYNFKTIQDITLYQLRCLINSHTADVIFRGYLSGLYSQYDMSKSNMSDVHWCSEQ